MDQTLTPESAHEKALQILGLIEAVQALKLTSTAAHKIAAKEIAGLRPRMDKLPNFTIGFHGATGTGKSSLINAILGVDILPAPEHGGAGSAVPVLISAAAQQTDARYEASVTFVSAEYLEDEITTLKDELEDLTSMSKDDHKVVWAKIHALYPQLTDQDIERMSVADIMNIDPNITENLGKKKTITANDPETFSKTLSVYISSTPPSVHGIRDLWPVIEQVEIFCQSPALSTGITLVDLPGTDDTNPARARMVCESQSHCDYIFVLGHIIRVTNSKNAHDLLEDNLKMRLSLEGKYNSDKMTFILTKNDDMDPNKPRALGLENDPEIQEIQPIIKCLEENASDHSSKAEEASSAAEDLDNRLAELKSFSDALQGLTQESDSQHTVGHKRKPIAGDAEAIIKRRKAGSQTYFHGNQVSSMTRRRHALLVLLNHNEKIFHWVTKEHFAAVRDAQKAQKAFRISQKQLVEASVRRWRLCSKKRSENITQVLQQQFRESLASMDDTNSSDINNYDHVKLQVLPVSARLHMAKIGNTRSQGELLANLDLEDTGIPALERHIHTLIAPIRQKFMKSILDRLSRLARRMFLDLGEVTALPMADRECFRKMFHAEVVTGLREGFNGSVNLYVQNVQARMNEALGADCRAAAQHAITMAPGISKNFALVHHNTYRAALRRGGRFRQDLNADLTHPFNRKIARAWATYFEGDLAGGLEGSITDVLNESLGYLEKSTPDYLARHVLALTSKVRDEVNVDVKQLSRDAQDTIGRQRKIASLVEPYVTKEMQSAYTRALQENGAGMDKRQKDVVHRHIDRHKEAIFNGAADLLVDRLQDTAKAVGQELQKSTEDLSDKIENLLSSLWQENKKSFHDPELVQARQDMEKIVFETENLLQMASQWE